MGLFGISNATVDVGKEIVDGVAGISEIWCDVVRALSKSLKFSKSFLELGVDDLTGDKRPSLRKSIEITKVN